MQEAVLTYRTSRRIFIKWLIAAPAVVAIGCNTELQGSDSERVRLTPLSAIRVPLKPTPVSSDTVFQEMVSWKTLSPLEKIKRLEEKKYPYTQEFDLKRELVSAVAHFFCENVSCNKTPKQLEKDVFFIPSEEFIQHVESRLGRSLKEKEKKERVEMLTEDKRVLINEPLFEERAQEIHLSQPEIVKELRGRDPKTVMLKSTLLHAFIHVNRSEESYVFEPFSIKLPGEPGPINVGELKEGFKLFGARSNGLPFIMLGADEAMTEYAAMVVGRKTGYLSLGENYFDGAVLVAQLNRKASVTDHEFLQYVDGTLPKKKLLKKWGALKNSQMPDDKAAIMTLATISFYVDGIFTREEAIKGVEQWLKIKF